MTVDDIVKKINLKVIAGKKGLNKNILTGHCSDMLSEVLSTSPEKCIWLTNIKSC